MSTNPGGVTVEENFAIFTAVLKSGWSMTVCPCTDSYVTYGLFFYFSELCKPVVLIWWIKTYELLAGTTARTVGTKVIEA